MSQISKPTWIILTLVLILTASLRWVRFSELPPGLWYDEAYTLAQAQRLTQGGAFQIYYPEKHGEPAIIWLTALALELGAGHLAPRWVSSASGVLSVLLLFFAVRDVMRQEKTGGDETGSGRAEWLALGSAAALGVNYDFLFHTRMSWQAALVTPFFVVTVWLFWRGMRGGRYRDFITAGLMAGMAQYTGVAARMLPAAVALVVVGWLGEGWRGKGWQEKGWQERGWQLWRDRWKGLLVAGGAALLAYAPLLIAFLANPEWFGRRLRTAASAPSLVPNLGRTLAGWLWLGEAAHHSLPGRPIYDPVMGALLLVGAAVAIRHIRRPTYNVWLAWFVGVLPGGFLSEPTPMFYRIMTAEPATSALCAIGGYQIWRFATSRSPRLRNLALLLLLAVFAFSTWVTCRDYFVRWASLPRLPAVMDVWKWRAAEAILDAPTNEALFVTIPDDLEPSLSYALHVRPNPGVRAFDGARCLVYPTQIDTPVHYLLITGYEHRSLPRLQALFPSGYRTIDPLFDDGAPYFVSFYVSPGTDVPVPGRLPSPIAYGDILLDGVRLSRTIVSAGHPLTVTLAWTVERPVPDSATVFVHVLDGKPEAAEAPLKAQHDGLPCYAAEPTYHWQPGEYVLDEHVLETPPDLSPGEYLLGVGLYDAHTLERIPPAGNSLNLRWGEAIVGSIMVTAP
jgi:hypothetical protein